MDLQKEWNSMNEEVMLNADKTFESDRLFIKKESAGLLKQLQKNLKMKFMWARAISLPVFIAACFVEVNMRYWLLGVVVAYELGRYLMFRKMKGINYEIDYSKATTEVISKQLEVIQQSLKVELIWGYLFIPFAGPLGFILSNLHKGKSFTTLLADPKDVLILLGLSLFAIPIIWLAKKMNKIGYGNYISKLNEYLKQMGAN